MKNRNRALGEWEIGEKCTSFSHYPDVLQIELTDRCNARCVMCHHYYEGNVRSGSLPPEIREKIETLLPYCTLVLLNGYGEPFLAPDFYEWLKLLHRHQVKAMVTTNLSVLKEEWLPLINEVFEQINISCDGYDRKSYEMIRQELCFDEFVKNVRLLRKNAPDVKLCMSAVAMAQNLRHVPEIIEFAAELGFDEVRFGRLGVNSYLKNYQEDLIHYEDAAVKYFREGKRTADRLGIPVIFPVNFEWEYSEELCSEQEKQLEKLFYPYTKEHREELEKSFLDDLNAGGFSRPKARKRKEAIACEGICDWVARGAYIDRNGLVSTCCENSQSSYGNLAQQSFEELWNGNEARKVRTRFFEGLLPEFCYNCPFIINQELSSLRVQKKKSLFEAEDYEQRDICEENE